MAVRFFHRRGINTPEAGQQTGRILGMGLHPFAGFVKLAEYDIENVAAPIRVGRG